MLSGIISILLTELESHVSLPKITWVYKSQLDERVQIICLKNCQSKFTNRDSHLDYKHFYEVVRSLITIMGETKCSSMQLSGHIFLT